MKELIEQIQNCSKCSIQKNTKHKTIGRGSKSPNVLFVGLNPGKEENETGRPFIGPSGKVLDKWIEYLELKPNEYAVVNIVKCYTPNESELNGDEIDNCFPYLEEQIELLHPRFIIPLGAKVVKKLMGLDGITSLAGRVFTPNKSMGIKAGIRRKYYIPMPHPAYYVRNGGHGWEVTLDDVKTFMQRPVGIEKVYNDQWVEEIPGRVELDFSKRSDEKPADALHRLTEEVKINQDPEDHVPLHLHTTYSIKDSAMMIDKLAIKAKRMGFFALAITDHGTISGWYEFQKECEEHGIKPILGIEFYVCNDYEEKTTKRYHLIALAKNDIGKKNIQKLVDISNRDGFYYKPRVMLEDVFKYKEGLIVTTACALGVVAQRITDKDQEGAEALLVKLKEEFGEDLYVELQPHDFDKQRIVNPILIKWAQKYDLPLLVATDAHYLEPEDIKYHKALKAIVFQSTMEKSGFSIDSNYVMDSEDLMQRCAKMDISEHIVRKAFDNSKRVAQQCKARLEPFKDALPKFQVEK
jgi:uracil-DNA glycosylase family 4